MDEYALWLEVANLRELGDLIARWLEGAITTHPLYGATTPDDETKPLVPVLARLNRAGYLTEQSQPGVPIVDGSGQRAFVSGSCTEATRDLIVAAVRGTDLVAFASPPMGFQDPDDWIRVPVTLDSGDEFTWVGGSGPSGWCYVWDEDTDGWKESDEFWVLDSQVWQEVASSCLVEVFDPVWGRDDLLWPTLDRALSGSSRR